MSGTTTDSSSFSGERVLGRVKWFNNRAGFGFISVLEGEKAGEDVFTHHSGISVDTEQYKYLVQGEYVEFDLSTLDLGPKLRGTVGHLTTSIRLRRRH